MRAALSLKPSNANTTSDCGGNNKATIKNAPLGGGKLKRQTGTSNLHQEVIAAKNFEESSRASQLIKFDTKENFEVYEDPDPVEDVVAETKKEEKDEKVNDENVEEKKEIKKPSENDNNVIHELERKMEEKRQVDEQKKKFSLTRDNYDIMSRCSEPPSESLSVSACDDDDFDKLSVASSTFTTTVRASFSTFHVDAEAVDLEAKKKTVIRKKVEKESRDDAMFCSDEYFFDILKYMMHRQMKNLPSASYFSRQEHVNEEMRTILIDWFNDVIKEYRLQKETFHLAVKLVDRCLTFLKVDKAQFQLVGTTALMIAAKYEEIFPPEIEEFAIITDNTYGIKEILSMERFLLGKFNFVIALPTAAWFGACFAKRMKFTHKMNKTMNYLLDLSLVDVDFLRYRPSDIAAAATCFTNLQYDSQAWPQKMIDDTAIKTEDFVDILRDLHRMYITSSSSDYKSIFNKYCEMDEKEVALSPAPTDKLRKLFPTLFGSIKKASSD